MPLGHPFDDVLERKVVCNPTLLCAQGRIIPEHFIDLILHSYNPKTFSWCGVLL